MPDTITLFFPGDTLIPIEELYELSAIDDIATITQDNRLAGYRIVWDDVTLNITFPGIGQQQALIDTFLEAVESLIEKRRDKKSAKVWRRAERMVQAIQCAVEPDWDTEHKAQLLIQGIMVYYDYAFMFVDNTLYNQNGNIEVGHEKSKRKYWAQEESEDDTPIANERKKRSIEILKAEDVPYIKHLRALPDEDEITLRSVEEVAKRAIVLNLIARLADGESQAWFKQKVEQYQVQDTLTEQENVFVEDANPPEYITILFSQRLEAFWTLAWVLQFHDLLWRPDRFCNAQHAHEILDERSLEQFLLEAKLRDKSEIMDTLDLHFRYHWSVTDAELYGKKAPKRLETDVVFQRHYALNWLVQLDEQDWDEVSTDT
jgi:hypothetical protein